MCHCRLQPKKLAGRSRKRPSDTCTYSPVERCIRNVSELFRQDEVEDDAAAACEASHLLTVIFGYLDHLIKADSYITCKPSRALRDAHSIHERLCVCGVSVELAGDSVAREPNTGQTGKLFVSTTQCW